MSLQDDHAAGDSLQVLHWWASGDGEAAFEALCSGFAERHPDAGVATAAFDDLGMEVKSRILRADPPDAWFEWPGTNLRPYEEAGVLADLDDVWTDGMARNYLDGVRDLARFDGVYRAVPVDIHRVNNLFYRVDLVEAAGIDPGRLDGPRELLEALAQVDDATGAAGLVQPMKDPWPVLQLWATVLLGEYGPDTYAAVTGGAAARHRDAVADALEVVAAYAEHATDDALFVDLTGANDRFVGGESAFFVQGDWAAGAFEEAEGFDYGAEWDHVPFPGTEGLYAMNTDAAIAAAGTDRPEAVERFLRYCGSADAQRRFNRLKGAIPPRTDVDVSDFAPFLRDQQAAFERSRAQPPSVAHGLAVTPAQLIDLKAAVSEFVGTWDVEAVADAVVDALDGD